MATTAVTTAFPPPDLAALAAYFLGQWQFDRTIWEGSETPQATAVGTFDFISGEVPGQLLYRERGQLRMLAGALGRPILFSRLFDYRFGADRVAVLFADGERVGQSYQSYLLRGNMLVPAADHLCGPDCYNAAYTLDTEDSFTMETFISGPKKRTRVLTVARRCGPEVGPEVSASPA
ncbi:hypothetical protein HBH1_02291 [Herbaspirillum sp. BH-1]|uniref:DUF6314 domain-containing protein n=1 Tax=Herbaspirillum frisingense TaxID=92645 RepID=A0ABU1P8J6_9BURK|nr:MULTISPECIES: DUF6314 family protein [Herbaspirillum]MDR6582226.1 hypothetical protein [Herbaspirillum frisingense]PLY59253.1 hypothetical protein HBH1_02291 [Herbaspirillum sp. BH-1]